MENLPGNTSASGPSTSLSSLPWLAAVFANIVSYSLVIVPVVFLVKFGPHWLLHLQIRAPFLHRALVFLIGDCQAKGSINTSKPGDAHGHHQKGSFQWNRQSLIRLAICVVGLQMSFLSWGILQERMVTLSYGPNSRKFRDSLFLVFGNRSLAFIIALVVVCLRSRYNAAQKTPESNSQGPPIPFYCYLFAACSNIMSTWFQYEALKFISFPLQVLSKTLKIIATMLLGRCIQNKTYTMVQYCLAGLITAGVTLFLFGNEATTKGKAGHGPSTSAMFSMKFPVSGITLLFCYLIFDSFTSNWEERLFRQFPSISSYDMMLGVNCWGTLLTSTALLIQGGFVDAWDFMNESGEFAFHVVLLAISSAVGSLFIYFTISCFGAVVFVTIMTVRQALAILLSCIIYGHEITPVGFLGLIVVFISLGFQIALRKQAAANNAAKTQQHLNQLPVSGGEDTSDKNHVNQNGTVPLLEKMEMSDGYKTKGEVHL